jgi:hypothetical protein
LDVFDGVFLPGILIGGAIHKNPAVSACEGGKVGQGFNPKVWKTTIT